MKRGILKLIEHFSERKAINKKTNVSIFLICFTISLFIWLLIKMSQDYTSNIDFPVKFTSPPTDKILTHTYDSVVSIELTTRGFDLLNLKLFYSKEPIIINLSGSNVRKYPNSISSYILTRNINSQILKQVEFTEQVTEISPDTLRFDLEKIISKKVAVLADIQITPKAQFQIYGSIRISPDFVTVSGPPSMIDTIRSIKTAPVKFNSIDKNINPRIKLLKPSTSNKLTLSVDSVDLFIPIEKFTENIVTLPIKIFNSEQDAIKLFPDNVKVTFLIAFKDYSNFQTEMLTAGINFDKEKTRQTVEIINQPSFIKITNLEPASVEYIILK